MTVSPTATADGTAAGPLFLYWASHACHGPVQVPRATFEKFSFIPDKQRRTYHGEGGRAGNRECGGGRDRKI